MVLACVRLIDRVRGLGNLLLMAIRTRSEEEKRSK
jgi:hypothetical protein